MKCSFTVFIIKMRDKAIKVLKTILLWLSDFHLITSIIILDRKIPYSGYSHLLYDSLSSHGRWLYCALRK